jgi:hypothetical protein
MHCDLWDLMKARYGDTIMTPYCDATLAIHDGLTAIRANGGRGEIIVPGGFNGLLKTQIDPNLLSGSSIRGDDPAASQLTYCKNSGVALYFSGANGFTGGGVRDLTLNLMNGMGDSTAYAILLQGDATYQPDEMVFENVRITSPDPAAFWYTGFQAYGNARTAPQGIRVVKIENVSIFQCRNVGLYLSNAVEFNLWGVRTYTGKPGTAGNDMFITGGGSQYTNSFAVYGEGVHCGGTLHVDNSSGVRINGTQYS